MRYGLLSGLPDLPTGKDSDVAMLSPIYRAIAALANNTSVATGLVQYTQDEMAQLSQVLQLLDARSQVINVKAGENLGYGELLALDITSGKITAHKADATNLARPALAICNAPSGLASGQYGEAVYMQGRCAGIGGTTLGQVYYLSTAGLVTATAPVATGVLNQVVGIGLGSHGFYLNIEPAGRRPAYIYKFNASTLRVLYCDGHYEDLAV